MRAISRGDKSGAFSVWFPVPTSPDMVVKVANDADEFTIDVPFNHARLVVYRGSPTLHVRDLPSLDAAKSALQRCREIFAVLSIVRKWPFHTGDDYLLPSELPAGFSMETEGSEAWPDDERPIFFVDWKQPTIYSEGDKVAVLDNSASPLFGTTIDMQALVSGVQEAASGPEEIASQIRIGAMLYARASAIGDPIRDFLDAFTVVEMLGGGPVSAVKSDLIDKVITQLEQIEHDDAEEKALLRTQIEMLKKRSMRQALSSLTERCVTDPSYEELFREIFSDGLTPRKAADRMYVFRNRLIHDTNWLDIEDLRGSSFMYRRFALLLAEFGLRERLGLLRK